MQDLDLESLRYVVQLVREFYELTGSWPSAAQLRALLAPQG
jgi:hypothetical protein